MLFKRFMILRPLGWRRRCQFFRFYCRGLILRLGGWGPGVGWAAFTGYFKSYFSFPRWAIASLLFVQFVFCQTFWEPISKQRLGKLQTGCRCCSSVRAITLIWWVVWTESQPPDRSFDVQMGMGYARAYLAVLELQWKACGSPLWHGVSSLIKNEHFHFELDSPFKLTCENNNTPCLLQKIAHKARNIWHVDSLHRSSRNSAGSLESQCCWLQIQILGNQDLTQFSADSIKWIRSPHKSYK